MKKDTKFTVYYPDYRRSQGIFFIFFQFFLNAYRYRTMIWELYKRDFFGSYRKSFLGSAWIFIAPLITVVSWIFMQYTNLLNPGELSVPYPVYVLLGTSIWGLFMGFYSAAANMLKASSSLINQVNFPHEIMLIKSAFEQFSNFLISFCFNIIIMLALGVIPHWETIFVPFLAIPLFFLGAAFGLFISLFGIIAGDVDRAASMVLGLVIYVTPIIYSENIASPIIRKLNALNPLTYLVCSIRDMVLLGRFYDVSGYLICAAAALVLFLISWKIFFTSEPYLIEKIL